MPQRRISFDANSLLKLLTHYTDGEGMPLDAELAGVGVSNFIKHWVVLMVDSDEWTDAAPLHVRYDGKKTLLLKAPGEQGEWKQMNERAR